MDWILTTLPLNSVTSLKKVNQISFNISINSLTNKHKFGKFNPPSKQKKKQDNILCGRSWTKQERRNRKNMTKSNCNSASYARDRWKSTIKWRRRKRFFVSQTGCNSHQSNKQKIIHPKVINLFNSCVTYTQARVLNKGFKFTPSSRRNNNKMEKDIHYFTRKLRLTLHVMTILQMKTI